MLVHQLNHCTLFYSISWSCLWKLSFYAVFQRLVWNTECQQLQPLNVINRRVCPWPIPGKVGKSHTLVGATGQFEGRDSSHPICCWLLAASEPDKAAELPSSRRLGDLHEHTSALWRALQAKAHLDSARNPGVTQPLLGMLLRRHQLSADWITNRATRDQCAKQSPNSITFSI